MEAGVVEEMKECVEGHGGWRVRLGGRSAHVRAS